MSDSCIFFFVVMLIRSCEMTTFDGFLGGYVNGFSIQETDKVMVEVTVVFDRSFVNCTSDTIGSVVLQGVPTQCTPPANCPTGLNFICTDFSIEDGLTIARAEYIITSPSVYVSIDINYAHKFKGTTGAYRKLYAKTTMNKFYGTFGGPLVYSIYKGCPAKTIKIPVDHLEDEIIACRRDAVTCDSMCRWPKGITLGTACDIKIGDEFHSLAEGMYAIILQVKTASEGDALAFNHLHIVLNLKTKIRSCHEKPAFVWPTPEDETCVQLFKGEVYKQRIIVQALKEDDRITEIRTTLLHGMTKTPVQLVPGQIKQYFVDVEYNPSSVDLFLPGARMFCFTGRDSSGAETDSRCVKIIPYIDALKMFIEMRQSGPGVTNLGSDVSMKFEFKSDVEQPKQSKNLTLYIVNNDALVQTYNLTAYERISYLSKAVYFAFPYDIFEENTYYVTLDRGAALLRDNFCQLQSLEFNGLLNNFTIRDMRPLVLTFLSNFTHSTTGNETIHWKFNKVVTSISCTLYESSLAIRSSTDCFDHWTITDLDEGNYSILVNASDNKAIKTTASYTWIVDFTSPHISCNNLPASVTNDVSLNTTCTFNESSSALCRVFKKIDTAGLFNPCVNVSELSVSYSYTGFMANTTYVFEVKATDKAGNSATFLREWTTDYTKPIATFTQRPESPSKKIYIDIKFVCNEPCRTKCLLQNGSTSSGFTECGGNMSMNTKTYRTPSLMSMTNYTFKVIATDAAGNEGDLLTTTWETDMDEPNCTIIKKPSFYSNERVAEFVFSCNEHCMAKCSLNKKGGFSSFEDCGGAATTNPKFFTTPKLVEETSYVFEYYCTDATGNNATIQAYHWEPDFVAPNITCQRLPAALSNTTTADIMCSCHENCSAVCRVRTAAQTDVQFESCSNMTNAVMIYSSNDLSDNTIFVFEALATDKAGNNRTFQYQWKTDYTKPNITIIEKPPSLSNKRHFDIKFSCNEACKTKCLLTNGSTSTGFRDCGGELSMDTKTFRTPSLVTMTNYTFKVIPTDGAGNEGVLQEASWEVDLDLPNCTIIEKPLVNSNETVVNIKIDCNEPCKAKCSMKKQGESPDFVECGGTASDLVKTYTTPTLVTDTMYEFMMFCTDMAGNIGATQKWQWKTDFVKPICIFTKKPTANSSELNVELQMHCNEATRLICTLKKGNHDPLNRDCRGDLSTESRTFNTKRLESGYMYTFTVHSFDASGNVGNPILHSWFTYYKTSLTITLNLHISDNPNNQDIFTEYIKKIKGPIKATKISAFRTGSLIVDYDTDPSDWNYVFTMLNRGNVIIDGAIVPVQAITLRQKDGTVLNISPSIHPCIMYLEFNSCPSHAPCVADGNTNAKCSSEFIGSSRDVIGLAAGIVVFSILLVSSALVVLFRKQKTAGAKRKETGNDSRWTSSSGERPWSQPRYHNGRFTGMSSEWFGKVASKE